MRFPLSTTPYLPTYLSLLFPPSHTYTHLHTPSSSEGEIESRGGLTHPVRSSGSPAIVGAVRLLILSLSKLVVMLSETRGLHNRLDNGLNGRNCRDEVEFDQLY